MARRTVAGILLAALVTLTLPVLACAQETDVRMPLDRLKKRMATDGVIVVDVREERVYSGGHIPGARSIPLDQVEARAAELSKSKTIVTYCG